MGYYVSIEASDAVIPAANLDEAYRRMCALNTDRNARKGGGSSTGERWFSWMDANYPETCKDAQTILEELGFYCSRDIVTTGAVETLGDLYIDGYDSKCGDEDQFLDAISSLCTGTIEWRGEDGERWRDKLGGPKVDRQYPTVTWG